MEENKNVDQTDQTSEAGGSRPARAGQAEPPDGAENKNTGQTDQILEAGPSQPVQVSQVASLEGETPAAKEQGPQKQPAAPFPVVGIGASAGGLEAFEKFFTRMPPDSGMAFVLIQHLHPTYKSTLASLIQRYTKMPVAQVDDQIKVEPNHIYIIPPNKDLAIFHSVLHHMEPVEQHGLRLPIDFFFRSLAEDQREKAICVVLSGTGSDGALGLRAIKGEGGLVMVQSPDSATYDGMPRSAMATGLVDYILPVEQMPEQLLAYAQQVFTPGNKRVSSMGSTFSDALQKIFLLLRTQTGHDFSFYKQNTTLRQIERRMTINQIDNIDTYIRYLQYNPMEVEILFKEFLIGVTHFFRDPEAFDVLKEEVIPRLFENVSPDQPIRVWIPGCATGEEPYSIAILLQEHMDVLDRAFTVQIFATDIDGEAIEKARAGVYPAGIVANVSAERLERFFTPENNTYRIKKTISTMVTFAKHSAIKDPPFSKLDLISCRNLLIYLNPVLQKKVFPLFHYALNKGGFLFLGNSETIGEFGDRFAVTDRKWKIFRRKEVVLPYGTVPDFSMPLLAIDSRTRQSSGESRTSRETTLRDLTEKALLEHYAPACAIVDERGRLLYVHGQTDKYLSLAPGEVNLNILHMARRGLKPELTLALRKVIAEKKEVRYEGVPVEINDTLELLDLSVRPMIVPTNVAGMPDVRQGLIMVTFEEVVPEAEDEREVTSVAAELTTDKDQRIVDLEWQLRAKEEYIQTIVEELETSNEELQASNEELQATNEELHSTNEELETTTEELQLVNKELIRTNADLQHKVEELAQANNDIHNLMDNTEVGIIFLDSHLNIQLFTPVAAQVSNLIESDVGRPVSHIVSNLVYDSLIEDVKAVLSTLKPKEAEVQSEDGRWHLMRIIPYRTTENVVQGTVLTFVDITQQKREQESLRLLTRVIEQSANSVIITSPARQIEYVNPRFTQLTGYLAEEVEDQVPPVLKSEKHPPEKYEQLWQTITGGEEWRGEFPNKKKDGSSYWEAVSIAPVKDAHGEIAHFVIVAEDITNQKTAVEIIRESEKKSRAILASAPEAIVTVNSQGLITLVNDKAEKMFGYSREELLEQEIEILIPPVFRENHRRYRTDYLSDLRSRPMGLNYNLLGRRKDGSEFPVEVGLSAIETKEDVLIISFITDITRRRQMEEELAYQAGLLQHVPDAVIATDMDLRITSWNKAAEKIYGWQAKEIMGKIVDEVLQTEFITEAQEEARDQLFAEKSWQGRLRQKCKDGQTVYMMASAALLQDSQGNSIGGVTVNRNITDGQHRVEEDGRVPT